LRVRDLILPGCAVLALAGASDAIAAGGGAGVTSGGTPAKTAGGGTSAKQSSGGASVGMPAAPRSTPAHPIVQGFVGKIIHGVAYAPSLAPRAIQEAIWAGNKIRHKPYIWGGGHQAFADAGYDCSGAVSFVLHAGGLLSAPMDSSEFMSWGHGGHGHWITVYTNPGHAFVQIAGIRFDTSAEQDPNPSPGSGPRWRPLMTDTSGFSARHPIGY
jgi:cell wall-associated NlpC family hydrolase